MNVQAFVPDWPGDKQHALATAAILNRYCQRTVILSDPDHYYTQQFNEMRHHFKGDILFSVVADVWPPKNVAGMIARGAELLAGSEVGIYAPDVNWNGHKFFRHKLRQLAPGVYDVPMPELLCWMIRKDVLDVMPEFDPKVNKLGWGIDYVAVAAARRLGRRAVRDYNFTAHHPRSRNYNGDDATRQMWSMINSLPGSWSDEVRAVYDERQRLAVRLTVKVIGSTEWSFYVATRISLGDVDEVRHYRTLGDLPIADLNDAQDVYYTEGVPSDDFIAACRDAGVINLWFPLPKDPATWNGGPNIWYWRHPKYVANLTDHLGQQVAWLLPQSLELQP